jgi:hypothetical protein
MRQIVAQMLRRSLKYVIFVADVRCPITVSFARYVNTVNFGRDVLSDKRV